MKKALLFVFSLLVVQSIWAQNEFFFVPDSVYEYSNESPIPFEVVAKADLVNKSSATANFDWVVIIDDMPRAWGLQFCDANSCYSPTVRESPVPVEIPKDSSSNLDVHVIANNFKGVGHFRVKVHIGADTIATGYYTVEVDESVSVKNVLFNYEVKAYPNPTDRGFILTTDYPDVAEVHIYNVIGKHVHVVSGIKNGSYVDISHLQNGLYLVQPISSKGEILTTKRITKK